MRILICNLKLFFDISNYQNLIRYNKIHTSWYSRYYTSCTNHSRFFTEFILDITILNIDYIANKQIKDVKEFLNLINTKFEVIGASNSMIEQALKIDNKDLEDNLQYIVAIESDCELIITNDKNFYIKDLSVLTSTEFVKKYL